MEQDGEMGRSTADEDRRPRGSSTSDRQIAYAVRDEKKVSFRFGEVQATGWVMGLDDYHWVVIDSSDRIHLIHKSCPLVTITVDTIDDYDEAKQRVLRDHTTKFREYILRTHFSTTPAKEQ